jgi:hypothetical protein
MYIRSPRIRLRPFRTRLVYGGNEVADRLHVPDAVIFRQLDACIIVEGPAVAAAHFGGGPCCYFACRAAP